MRGESHRAVGPPERSRIGLSGRAEARAGADIASAKARRAVALFPEIDCVRARLPVAVIAAAERRAGEVGLSADRVLISAGLISEEAYVRALCRSLGLAFQPLDGIARAHCPVDDRRLIEAVSAGLLPLEIDGRLVLVVAPRAVAARRLIALARESSRAAARIQLTTGGRLRRFVDCHAATALGFHAAEALRARRPELSAALPAPHSWRRASAAGLILAALSIASESAAAAAGVALAGVFLAWTCLRCIGLVTAAAAPRQLDLPAHRLPIYTIVVALYRETAALDGLVAALDRLDYPPEKLDIKLVLEADDEETRAAIEAMRLREPYEVVTAPRAGPRTKPKALNAALPFARGTFLVVYDAEDRPAPDQLKRAIDAFLSHGRRLACLQARLTIDNTDDNWLTRLYTAEYAGLFDVFLPALASHALPLPLGGSSNHFRTAVLREVGAWDPHNVTEDADLGTRLARHGYITGVIASTTYEEAPARLRGWLNQRTRWFKGWMKTWLVHMRSPLRLWRELGPAGFITFQLVVGGTVLASLVHPVFLSLAAVRLFGPAGPMTAESVLEAALVGLYGGTFIAGYLVSMALGAVGLARRGLAAKCWVLLLVPVLWVLLSVAAWRAIYKLLRDPFGWDKTEHGLARTSRRAARR